MIEIRRGDIFQSDADALVNPVNTVGTMGAGLAKEFRQRFPGNYLIYKEACRQGDIAVGRILPVLDGGVFIINFPTKDHWRNPSKIEWITSGLRDLRGWIDCNQIRCVAIPALGCGYGGLEWDVVRKEIFRELDDLDAEIIAFPPQ